MIRPGDPIVTDIIDVARGEVGGNVAAAAAQGLAALWAKTSQGKDWLDPSCAAFLDAARDAHVLRGEYHFGSNSSDGAVQADWFLAHARRDSLFALDWENNPDTKNGTMSLANAEAFVARVFERTRRWPVLYSGASFLREHAIPSTSVLGHCPLWLAQYGEEPLYVPSPWSAWDLWQYTDVAAGPHDTERFPRHTPGLGRLVDRSVFRGTPEKFAAWWAVAGLLVPTVAP